MNGSEQPFSNTERCNEERLHTAIHCGTLCIIGRPILLGNLTFVWRAPSTDVGALTIEASVVYNDAYVTLRSRSFGFNNFPVGKMFTVPVFFTKFLQDFFLKYAKNNDWPWVYINFTYLWRPIIVLCTVLGVLSISLTSYPLTRCAI